MRFVGGDKLWEKYYSDFQNVASPLRSPALFEWLYKNYTYLYLPCVEASDISDLADLKTCLCMIDVAVDDSCDNLSLIEKKGGESFTFEMLDMLYNMEKKASKTYTASNINHEGVMYVRTTHEILKDLLENHIMTLPHYRDFRAEFFLAVKDVANSMEFSYLVNRNKVIYPFSYVVSHRAASTMVAVHSILDLMASEDFDPTDLGKAVALFKMADVVAMLSNTVNTWTREIIEKDYSSPVLSLALERKLITFSDFEKMDVATIEESLSPLSETIEEELNISISKMRSFAENNEIKSFDASKFIDNYSRVREQFKAREFYWGGN